MIWTWIFDKASFLDNTIPVLGTLLLLASGFTINCFQRLIKIQLYFISLYWLYITLLLGLIFLFIQQQEYMFILFCINDAIFGCLFYFLTGFHGLHVIVGALFITNILYIIKTCNWGFTITLWYWHFVDIVWLILFIIIYL